MSMSRWNPIYSYLLNLIMTCLDVDDDRPFIVLAETKPSKRHIPVWARYSPLLPVVVVIRVACGLGVARQWWVGVRWEFPVSCLLRRFLKLDGRPQEGKCDTV